MQQKTFEMFLFSVGAETFAVKVKLRKSTHFFLHTQIVDKRFFFFFFYSVRYRNGGGRCGLGTNIHIANTRCAICSSSFYFQTTTLLSFSQP